MAWRVPATDTPFLRPARSNGSGTLHGRHCSMTSEIEPMSRTDPVEQSSQPGLARPPMSVTSPDPRTKSQAVDKAPPSNRHLVVWVGNNPQAEALVRHAAELVAASGTPWTAICVETPGAPGRCPPAPACLAGAAAGGKPGGEDRQRQCGQRDQRRRRSSAQRACLDGPDRRPCPGRLARRTATPWLGSLADALNVRLPGVVVDVIHFPDATGSGAPVRRPARIDRVATTWLAARAGGGRLVHADLGNDAALPRAGQRGDGVPRGRRLRGAAAGRVRSRAGRLVEHPGLQPAGHRAALVAHADRSSSTTSPSSSCWSSAS